MLRSAMEIEPQCLATLTQGSRCAGPRWGSTVAFVMMVAVTIAALTKQEYLYTMIIRCININPFPELSALQLTALVVENLGFERDLGARLTWPAITREVTAELMRKHLPLSRMTLSLYKAHIALINDSIFVLTGHALGQNKVSSDGPKSEAKDRSKSRAAKFPIQAGEELE